MQIIITPFILKLIEVFGTITGLIYLYYSVNERIELWIWGFLSSLFTFLIFYLSQLYSESVLQIYYLIISIYGWYIWRFGVVENHQAKQIIISKISIYQIFSLTFWFIFIYLVILYLLIKGPSYLSLTPTQVPYFDAFCTSGSIIGTWMLSRKLLENWLVWVVVDFVSIGISVYKGLYFYAFLFLIYTVVSIVGYRKWGTLISKSVVINEKL